METKALKKQMGAAIAMVLVAAIALAASTYAWFVSNNTVNATTNNISAQSNAPFLKIDTNDISSSSTTTINFSVADKALYPAQVVNSSSSPLFQSAYASDKDEATMLANSRYDVGAPDVAAGADFAVEQAFKIGTVDDKAGSFKDLKVSAVELQGTNKDLADGLKDAISVLLVCDGNWAVYKASSDGTVLTSYFDNISAAGTSANGVLADTISAGGSVEVKAYLFYDGSAEKVYTSNINNLNNVSLNIVFTATPVNTQGTAVDGANNDVNA